MNLKATALAAALVTAPCLLVTIWLLGNFAVGCKAGFLEAFRVALKARR